jgi:hypothetical protein
MSLAVLLQTSRASAEATVERLQACGIEEAQVIDQPNVIARLASGGSYRVRVGVPEQELAAAQAELARWDAEARPRVRKLAREVQVGLSCASLPAAALGAWFATWPKANLWSWAAVIGLWLLGLSAWALRSRRHPERAENPAAPEELSPKS